MTKNEQKNIILLLEELIKKLNKRSSFSNLSWAKKLKKGDEISARVSWQFNQDNQFIGKQDMIMETKVIGIENEAIFFKIVSQKNVDTNTREYWKFNNGRIIIDLKLNQISYDATGFRDDVSPPKDNTLLLQSVLLQTSRKKYRGFIKYGRYASGTIQEIHFI